MLSRNFHALEKSLCRRQYEFRWTQTCLKLSLLRTFKVTETMDVWRCKERWRDARILRHSVGQHMFRVASRACEIVSVGTRPFG